MNRVYITLLSAVKSCSPDCCTEMVPETFPMMLSVVPNAEHSGSSNHPFEQQSALLKVSLLVFPLGMVVRRRMRLLTLDQ